MILGLVPSRFFQIPFLAALTALFCLLPTSAQADVLEVGGGGSRWVAGGVAGGIVGSGVVSGSAEDLGSVPEVLPGVAGDIGAHARGVPAGYRAKVLELSARFDVSPSLIEALVWQESRWNARAVSPVGARGLAQLMPGTARDLGVNPDDPFANLEGGARYLRMQLDRFDGDVEKALAAYNAGPGRVARAGGIPRIRETQNYVAAIMGRLSDHSRAPDHSRVAGQAQVDGVKE